MEHQLCYAHGLHLAVSDVLYKNTVIHDALVSECNEHEWSSAEHHSEDDETDTGENDSEFITSMDFQYSENEYVFNSTNIELSDELA